MSSVLTQEALDERDAVIMMSVTQKLYNPGAELLTWQETYDYVTEYFPGSYFLNDHPLSVSSFPWAGMMDLETMEILFKGNPGDGTADEFLALAAEAAAD